MIKNNVSIESVKKRFIRLLRHIKWTLRTVAKRKTKVAVREAVNPLKDKVIVNFGDSIFGNFDAPDDISTKLAELTGATVYNCGFGGCQMAKHSSEYYYPFSMCCLADAIVSGDFSLQEEALKRAKNDVNRTGSLVIKFPTTLAMLKQIDFKKVDIITIAYGTNDWQRGIPLDHDTSKLDTNCVAGALRYSVEMILTKYPHVHLFLCSPMYRFWSNPDGSFNYDSDSPISAVNGVLLADIIEIERKVAKEYKLPFIDYYYELGINRINRLHYISSADGTHPNLSARQLMAAHMARNLF